MNFLVTGGAGFIGSHFVDLAVKHGHRVIVLDKLTYAGSEKNLKSIDLSEQFIQGDICHGHLVSSILRRFEIDALFNFAAESHVDRSIFDAESFVDTNIVGTYSLLKSSFDHYQTNKNFKFIQISTDEVFGDLSLTDLSFTEESSFNPRSPYSASKASADHLVMSWHHTFGLPVLITHCSNNYGPRQYPEKLIPFAVQTFIEGGSFGIHGTGENIRDWLHVSDHVRGIYSVWMDGRPGARYLFGGAAERTNLEVIKLITTHFGDTAKYHFVPDRLGNDRRYSINFEKAKRELGWEPVTNFEFGLRSTVNWYLENPGYW